MFAHDFDQAALIELMRGVLNRNKDICGAADRCKSCYPELFFQNPQNIQTVDIDEDLGGFFSNVYNFSSLLVVQHIAGDAIACVQQLKANNMFAGRNVYLNCRILDHCIGCIGSGPAEVVVLIKENSSDKIITAKDIRSAFTAQRDHIDEALKFCEGRTFRFEGILVDLTSLVNPSADVTFLIEWGS